MLINSATHLWGERPFDDAMSPSCMARNVPWLHWLLQGENWHNNHHAAPTSASTWVGWYQLDGIYGLIRLLEVVGLATDVRVEVPMARAGESVGSAGEFLQFASGGLAFLTFLCWLGGRLGTGARGRALGKHDF